MIVYDPAAVESDGGARREIARFSFPRQDGRDRLCLADYFRSVDSGDIDVMPVQVVTVGDAATKRFDELQAAGEYSEAYFVHGIAVEAAEAVAEWLHRRIRSELGIPGGRGKRYSWGYGACPDLDDHDVVFKLLPASDALGMTLTSAFQLVPEQSTAAMIVHHPEAKYYSIRGEGPGDGQRQRAAGSAESRVTIRVTNHVTTRATLLERLLDPESVVVFDGAMGTMLYARGVFINQCYDELNTRAPDLVRAVHAEYAKAGAEVLETNTFGANRIKLTQYGLETHAGDFNRAAAQIARDVAGDTHLVAGAVGPLGVRLEPYGPTSMEEARAAFAEQMAALKEGGADLFIIETFGDLEEIGQAVRAARDVDPTMPVVAQMTIGSDGHTPFGASPEDVAAWLDGLGADVIGLNCSVGPQGILEGIERMVHVTRRKLSAQPNAGMPRDVGGRAMYMASAEYMASYARHLVQAGAKVVGGCCGTTPEHIHAIAEGVRPLVASPRPLQAAGAASSRVTSPEPRATSRSPGIEGRSTGPVRDPLEVRRQDRREGIRHVGRDRAAPRRQRRQDADGCLRACAMPASTRSTSPTVRARRAAWAHS